MKKIRVLSTGETRRLKDNIPHNIDNYKVGTHDWLDEIFAHLSIWMRTNLRSCMQH